MTSKSFITQWLKAPQEVKDSVKWEGYQKWACPKCFSVLDRWRICPCIADANGESLLDDWITQPIPRLDQLLGMVKNRKCLDDDDYSPISDKPWRLLLIKLCKPFFADTPEEAVLKAILWEQEH